jgi:glycosyltransferase involved in cell wall biosynthesis
LILLNSYFDPVLCRHRRLERIQVHAAPAEGRYASIQHALYPVQFVAARRPRACGVGPTDGKVDGHHKEEALLETHFLVLPTRYPHEGQPLVLIEAMSAGAVPVTTDQGGILDLMSFAGSERLVSPSHETGPGVARTIEALVREPGEYEALSALCLERFRSHLTIDRCATEILAVVRGGAAPGIEAWESKRAAV